MPPATSPATHSESGWRFVLRALRQRNYRLFFTGQSLSLIGTWMTRVAINWLVYRLTGSAWMLGLVAFLGQIPLFILGPFAGVWVDRWSRHRTLVWTQALSMLQSLALAAIAFRTHVPIWPIAVLALLQGFINAFDTPARQAFLIEMVEERAVLSNAIALNSIILNFARLIGPAVGGFLIAATSEAWCFALDGVSYGAVILSLLLMRLAAAPPRRREEEDLRREMREGFIYIAHSVPIRSILLLVSVASLMGMPYATLLPIFAKKYLHGGAHTLGLLMSASGVGALVGALMLAARRTVVGLAGRIGQVAALFGVALVAFSFSRSLMLSLAMMTVTGFSMMMHTTGGNTILQTISEPDKRGRVMSYYTMALMGMMPFGSLIAGGLAANLGAPRALAISGLACVAGTAIYFAALPSIRRALRPIYVELGILPRPAASPESAAK
jgi:MFS family permease